MLGLQAKKMMNKSLLVADMMRGVFIFVLSPSSPLIPRLLHSESGFLVCGIWRPRSLLFTDEMSLHKKIALKLLHVMQRIFLDDGEKYDRRQG